MNNLYETGGVNPLPPWLQERVNKCQNCGAVFVAAGTFPLCGTCAVDAMPLCDEDHAPRYY